MRTLAIVIPAFKPQFLGAALGSIAQQTDRRFRVYVGNDGGPRELEAQCADFPGLDAVYRRFPDNLGRHSLPEHWNRCVRMSSEPWVWLFADDDVMAPDCVESFHRALDEGEPDSALVRFQTDRLDAAGRVVRANPPHPASESRERFLFSRLLGERESFAVEYVFRRSTFEAAGGFPDYPAAWCADDVAWFTFAGDEPIRTLPSGRVGWRASGLNITDARRSRRREKFEAAIRFVDFVRPWIESSRAAEVATPEEWRRASERWLLGQIRSFQPMGPRFLLHTLRATRGRWHRPAAVRAVRLALWNLRAIV